MPRVVYALTSRQKIDNPWRRNALTSVTAPDTTTPGQPFDQTGQGTQFAPTATLLVAHTFDHQHVARLTLQQGFTQNAAIRREYFDGDDITDHADVVEQRLDPAQKTPVGKVADG